MFGTMGKLLENLKEYFKNTSQEQIDKDFEEIEKYNEIGPSVDEYLKMVKEIKKYDIIIFDYPDIIDSKHLS